MPKIFDNSFSWPFSMFSHLYRVLHTRSSIFHGEHMETQRMCFPGMALSLVCMYSSCWSRRICVFREKHANFGKPFFGNVPSSIQFGCSIGHYVHAWSSRLLYSTEGFLCKTGSRLVTSPGMWGVLCIALCSLKSKVTRVRESSLLEIWSPCGFGQDRVLVLRSRYTH